MQPKNAHALNNAWKRQDTTKDLIVWFSGVMPNPAHAWTVRVADSKGYLGDYDATLQGNRFVIDTGQFADFPVGDYVLEVWETYSKDGKAETGIYPNPDSFITFKINANVVGDDLIKSFDFDEILGKAAARANKAIVVDGTDTLPAGSQAAVESRYDGERVHFTFKLPQGVQGIQGPQGVAGKDGHSVWQNVTHRGPENTDCWFTDLVNASASNPPKVNDIIITEDGNMAMITKVNITNDTGQGGGTFDYGPWVGNIKGPTGPAGPAGRTPVRGTDYWTTADQDAIKQWINDAILNGKW